MTEGPLADRRSAEILSFEVGGDRVLVARFIHEITKHFGPPREAIVIRPAQFSGTRRESIPTARWDGDQSAP
jgi:hypothetical protein